MLPPVATFDMNSLTTLTDAPRIFLATLISSLKKACRPAGGFAFFTSLICTGGATIWPPAVSLPLDVSIVTSLSPASLRRLI